MYAQLSLCFRLFSIFVLTCAATISRFNGQDRLRDLLAQAPDSITFSFQRVVIPLLRVLTSDPIRKSVVQTWSNVLYAALHGMDGLELWLARLAQECLVRNPYSCAASLPRAHRRSQAVAGRSWYRVLDSISFCPSRAYCGRLRIALMARRLKSLSWRPSEC